MQTNAQMKNKEQINTPAMDAMYLKYTTFNKKLIINRYNAMPERLDRLIWNVFTF